VLQKLFPVQDTIDVSDDENSNDIVVLSDNENIAPPRSTTPVFNASTPLLLHSNKEINDANNNDLPTVHETAAKEPRPDPLSELLSKKKLMPSAASYARPIDENKERQTFTVRYKEQQRPKVIYDQQEEAAKLNTIKEKIYSRAFLQLDGKMILLKDAKKESPDAKQEQETTELTASTSKSTKPKLSAAKPTATVKNDQNYVPLKKTLRQRSKSVYFERVQQNESVQQKESVEGTGVVHAGIPIKKTSRPIARGKKRPIDTPTKLPEVEEEKQSISMQQQPTQVHAAPPPVPTITDDPDGLLRPLSEEVVQRKYRKIISKRRMTICQTRL
jgi:hypothetical protein